MTHWRTPKDDLPEGKASTAFLNMVPFIVWVFLFGSFIVGLAYGR